MNFVGKIFTVLILFLSIAFMMIAVTIFQTHRNWRLVAEEYKKEQRKLTDINQRLSNEIQLAKDRLQLEAYARQAALAALQVRSEQAETQLETRSQEFASLQERAGTMATQIESNTKALADVLTQNGQLRTNLRDAQQNRDQSFERVVQLTDLLNQSKGNLSTMLEYNQQLIASNARMKLVMDRQGLDEFVSIAGPPRVDGIVTEMGAKDLLEVSIGNDDGLKKNHTLEVYRGNVYLGRVIVRDTKPDTAVVQIIPEYRKGIIKKGDRVATKFE